MGRKPCGLQGFRLGPPVCGVVVLGETLCPGHSAGVAIAHSQPFPSPRACLHCAPGTVGGHVEVCLVLGSWMPQGRAPGSLGVSPLRCCFLPQVFAGGSAQPSASVGTLPRVSAFTLPSLSGLPGCVGSHLPRVVSALCSLSTSVTSPPRACCGLFLAHLPVWQAFPTQVVCVLGGCLWFLCRQRLPGHDGL